MASSRAQSDPVCAICLEAPDELKVVTTCKHAFCRRCLQNHITSLGQSGDSFPCPTCQVQCPLPEDGVDGLRDYSEEADTVDGDVLEEKVPCSVCQYSNSTVQATCLCQDCGNFYLCKDCTVLHKRNKATSEHAVVSLRALRTKTGGKCRKHTKELLCSYCCSCAAPCCLVCVMLDHGDHDVKKIVDVFRSLLNEIEPIVADNDTKLADLEKAQGQLKWLSGSSVARTRDSLLHEIEDQAEKCIGDIIAQKTTLKEEVMSKYEVVTSVSSCLDKAKQIEDDKREIVKAKALMSTAEPHSRDIERLSALQQRMKTSGIAHHIDVEGYYKSFKRLFNNPVRFVPNATKCNLGDLEVIPRKHDLDPKKQLIFEKRLDVDDKAKFIPHVSYIRDDFYAVARPIKGGWSTGIDIYKLPGEFQRTITDHVYPLYGMAATPEGNLAVLSTGNGNGICCVHQYNPEAGYLVRSSQDFPLCNPLSMDINAQGQYVILSNDSHRVVTVLNEDGTVEKSYPVAPPDFGAETGFRINCHLGRIVMLWNKGLYDVIRGKVLKSPTPRLMKDIASFPLADMVIASYEYENNYKLWLLDLHESSDEATHNTQYPLSRIAAGDSPESRVSVGPNHFITSQGHTIRVYQFD